MTGQRLTCAFGSRWYATGCGTNGPCRKCRAYAAQLEREFWLAVLLGDYDVDGYTAADRRAQIGRAS